MVPIMCCKLTEGRRNLRQEQAPLTMGWAVSVASCVLAGSRNRLRATKARTYRLEPLSYREIAEGKHTKDSHNAEYGCPSEWIVKPLN